MNFQDAGGTRKTVKRGIDAVKAMLSEADKTCRRSVAASHLVVGLECGGSDLETAPGRKSKSELLGFGDSEFSPWMLGATL